MGNNINPAVGYNETKFLSTPILYGKDIELKLANGEVHKGKFAIVDLENIKASHNEKTYGNTDGYPLDANGENVNDRNYTNDISAQSKIIEFAQGLEPDRLITTSRTPAGTPIITTDGIVVSGNNRTMSLKLAASDFPQNYDEYKRFLKEEGEAFGFSNHVVTQAILGDSIVDERHRGETFRDNKYIKFNEPVLVRIDYDFPAYNALELSKYNKDTKKSERPIDKALKLGKVLESSDRCTKIITDIIGQYETFTEFYANRNDQNRIKQTLVECSILTSQETPAYFTESGFTEQGKELIESLLAGMVLSKDALFASNEGGARIFRQTIITSLPVLIANNGLGEDSLNKYLNDAVVLQSKLSSSGQSFSEFLVQQNMFDEKPNVKTLFINRLLASGRNNFKKSFEAYNASIAESQKESLFGDKLTPNEIFKAHIENKVPTIDKEMIEASQTVETTTKQPMSEQEIFELWKRYNQEHKDSSGSPNYMKWGTEINLSDETVDKLYAFNSKVKEGGHFTTNMYNVNSIDELNEMLSKAKTDWENSADERGSNVFVKLAKNIEDKRNQQSKLMETTKTNPFINGNFFKEKPENILAETINSFDRWKKPVTEYKGGLENLSRIQAQSNFIEATESNNPILTVETTPIFEASDTDTQKVDNLQEAIEATKKTQSKKSLKRAEKAATRLEDAAATESYTVREVFEMINPEVSINELRCFMWWKNRIGRPIESDEWLSLTGLSKHELYHNDILVREWINEGLLYYFDGELVPAYLYLAENVYDKKARLQGNLGEGVELRQGSDATYIIENYGKQVYDNQIAALDAVFKKKYDERLLLSGVENDDSLIISPVSKFAKEFMIKSLVDDKPFRWKKITAASNKYYGKPDFLESYVNVTNQYEKGVVNFEELSLTDAFCLWLRTDDTIQFKKGMNYADIIRVYIQAKSKPATTAIPDDDGKFVGTQLVIKKKEDAEWERLKSKAKSEADRLFRIFLSTMLTANDRVAIEHKWNRDFNGYVKINYNKVPVAFVCNRWDGNVNLEIKPEKREAVAFTFSEGSGLLAYDVGVGKGNLNISNILTPKGWVKMGTIKVGDLVIGKDGQPTTVEGVYPLGTVQCYKVTFSDGSFTEVSDEHLWDVQTINYRNKYPNKWDTVRTMDIKDKLFNYRGDYQFSIPMVEPVKFDEQPIPIEPYLLGALLGDGCVSSNAISFCNPEKDVQEKVSLLLPIGLKLRINKNGKDCAVTTGNIGNRVESKLLTAIKELGLHGKKSHNKFIPDCYKFNTPKVRLEVLQGLLDTDGYLDNRLAKTGKNGCLVEYTTISKQLKDDVIFLVQSFGGTCTIREKIPTYIHNGEKKKGQLAYTITIRLPKGIVPVTSKKHLAKFIEKTKYQPVRFIESIEDIGMQEAQCIRVAAKDHLYVCDDFIVTHNTISAIFTVSQFLTTGYAKRPLLVVPNQTYKQWIAEFKKFAAHIKINEFYNLSKDYIEDFKDVAGNTKMVEENSVSIITYEGMKQIGFTDSTTKELTPELSAILMQMNTDKLSDKKKDREAEKLASKVEELIGKSLSKSVVNVEDLGFDFISFDEAHACKKVFTFVKGEAEENLGNSGKNTRSISRYQINSGTPSFNGVKGFMLCHYIQQKYKGNTLLLTATPFTNSPLEIYSMLAMIAFQRLKKMQLDNLNTFFDTFIQTSYEMIINSRLKPERRQIILGFNNLISLQTLIRRFINYKTGEEVKVPRPNKIVLPLRHKMVDGIKIELNEDEKVETILPLSPIQEDLMNGVMQYADGEISEDMMCTGALVDDEENENEAKAEGVEIDEDALSDDEKVGVRLLKAMNHARNLALSPYIFSCSGLGKPTPKSYVQTSNKLNYVMESIRTIKEYHEKEGTAMSGVVIYMDRGVEYFNLLRQYLIDEIGFEPHEVGIISSKVIVPVAANTPKDEQKEYVKNLFLGDRFNNATLEMEKLSDKERLKVVIGSSTIKEGINLQKHSSVLFNCWMDWNPTDIQQLEGRIYRQGNKFKTVRIVNPLMIDSMDIFMFQKLEEKTSRINTIWQNDGRVNVLKTEDFNPSELKNSLIKNTRVLAEMQLLEIGEKIDEDIADAENKIKRNEKIKGYAYEMSNREKDLQDELEDVRPLADGQPQRSLESNLKLFQEAFRTQLDSKGGIMAHSWEKDWSKLKKGEFYSDLGKLSKPYWFDDLNFAVRNLKREERDYLAPNGMKITDLDNFSLKLKSDIENMRAEKEKLTSKEAIAIKAQEIQDKRDAEHIEPKTVEQCVTDFKKLNYLLSEIAIPKVQAEKEVEMQCPPLDASGKVRVDKEGLEMLDKCIAHEPDTKRANTDAEGNYTPERKALHEYIIKELTGDTVCIERGQPIAILTGGSPASGKSTFLNAHAPYLKSNFIWKIDADAVRDYFPEYKGWNAGATHHETQDVVNQLLKSFDTPCKHDLLYDGTMTNAEKYLKLIDKLKRMGYMVFIAFMDIPKEVSMQRALGRYANNKGGTTKFGRYVPMSVIEDFYKTGTKVFEQIKKEVDGYVLVDSLTQNIIDRGGRSIPADRDYKALFEEKTISENKVANVENGDVYLQGISDLEYLISIADNKKQVNEYEQGIKDLEFLKTL